MACGREGETARGRYRGNGRVRGCLPWEGQRPCQNLRPALILIRSMLGPLQVQAAAVPPRSPGPRNPRTTASVRPRCCQALMSLAAVPSSGCWV